MNNKLKVLDIGGRYGIHPSWKGYENIIDYYLVEADPKECERLKKKYKNNKNLKVYNYFISNSNNKFEYLNLYKNKAMSSSYKRVDNSPIYKGSRLQESNIIKKIKVKNVSLDNFIKKFNFEFDFLKVDIEGAEKSLFLSSKNTVNQFLGIRSEVNFSKIFKEVDENFSFINDFMNKNNFNLLNLDYDGRGDLFHKFANYKRHGILKSTDAVYIKNINYLIKLKKFEKLLKLVVFLFLNKAEDVAFYILNNIEDEMIKKKTDKLIEKIKFLVVKFLYQLKWQPGQDIKTHKKWYEKKFKESYPAMSLYNESNKFNPN